MDTQHPPARGTIRSFASLLRGHGALYAAAITAMVLATCLLFLPPLIIKFTIDGILDDAPIQWPAWVAALIDQLGGHSALAQRLYLCGIAIFAITALAGVCMYLRGRWAAKASESIARRLRERLYDHIQRQPCAYHDRAQTGDLVQRCTSDVETVRVFLASQVTELAHAGMNLAIAIPIMLMLDWRMTLASTLILPIIVVFGSVFFVRIKRDFLAMDEAEGALTTVLQENLTGIRVVRAFARQQYECEKFDQRNSDHREKNLRMYNLFAWYWSSSDLLVMMQMGITLFAGAWWVMLGPERGGISVGTLVAFWTYLGIMVWPVRQMGRILSELGKAIVATRRIDEVLQSPAEQDPPRVAHPLPTRAQGRIVFDNVSFGHVPDAHVLCGVSLTIEPGQTLAIVGPSGAGKSTLVNLLLRFYDDYTGRITLDGNDLRELPRAYVRAQVGVVMQEPFLYSKSVRDNLKIGRHDAGDNMMIEMTRAASVHDAIEQFEHQYDTLVGERGVTLSGGQRQRVALARALLQQPPIMVLDDAFSAVDTRTESMILRALRERQGTHTTLVIAHRLTTLMHADHIVVLEAGRVTEAGTHAQLIGQPGLYQRLWYIQSSLEDDLAQTLNPADDTTITAEPA